MDESDLSVGEFWLYFVGFIVAVLFIWYLVDADQDAEREQARIEVGSDYSGVPDMAP